MTESYEVINSVRESEELEQEEYELVHAKLRRETKWGFNIKSKGDAPLCRVTVSTVTGNSQAAKANIMIGDILAEVEGIGVRGLPWGWIRMEILSDIFSNPDPHADPYVTVSFLRLRTALTEQMFQGAAAGSSRSEGSIFEPRAGQNDDEAISLEEWLKGGGSGGFGSGVALLGDDRRRKKSWLVITFGQFTVTDLYANSNIMNEVI